MVNDSLIEALKPFVLKLGVTELFKYIIKNVIKNQTKHQTSKNKRIGEEVIRIREKITKARDLLLAGDLDASDYRQLKVEGEEKINRLEAKMCYAVKHNEAGKDIDLLLSKCIEILSKLDKIYIGAMGENKRKIIGSIFQEKLCFDGSEYEPCIQMNLLS